VADAFYSRRPDYMPVLRRLVPILRYAPYNCFRRTTGKGGPAVENMRIQVMKPFLPPLILDYPKRISFGLPLAG
jgi:hypothetical protein